MAYLNKKKSENVDFVLTITNISEKPNLRWIRTFLWHILVIVMMEVESINYIATSKVQYSVFSELLFWKIQEVFCTC